jgi:hypothetical protein
VLASIGDYYNFEYGKAQETHYSIAMAEEAPHGHLHGYVSKSFSDGRRLVELLFDGKKHRLTLELQFVGPSGEQVGTDHGVVAITNIVSESWVAPAAPVAEAEPEPPKPNAEEVEAKKKAEEEARKREEEEKARAKAEEAARVQAQVRKDAEAKLHAEEVARKAAEKAPVTLKEARRAFADGKAAKAKLDHSEACDRLKQATALCWEIVRTVPETRAAGDARELLKAIRQVTAEVEAEIDAARLFKLAKRMADEASKSANEKELVEGAQDRLRTIVDNYPKTVAAAEAKELLKKLKPKRN